MTEGMDVDGVHVCRSVVAPFEALFVYTSNVSAYGSATICTVSS